MRGSVRRAKIRDDDMTGLYHWVLNYLQDAMAGNLTFELYAVKPPPSLQAVT